MLKPSLTGNFLLPSAARIGRASHPRAPYTPALSSLNLPATLDFCAASRTRVLDESCVRRLHLFLSPSTLSPRPRRACSPLLFCIIILIAALHLKFLNFLLISLKDSECIPSFDFELILQLKCNPLVHCLLRVPVLTPQFLLTISQSSFLAP